MKKIILITTLYLISPFIGQALSWLMFSFVLWELDPSKISESSRFGIMLIGLIFTTLCILAVNVLPFEINKEE